MIITHYNESLKQTVINSVRFMVLTAIFQCVVCATKYIHTEYYSNACKQQAYLNSEVGVPLLLIPRRETPAYDFSFSYC